MMNYREEYGPLLAAIVQDGDLIAMRYFRAIEMRVERKDDGSAVTQADRGVEEIDRKSTRLNSSHSSPSRMPSSA